MILKSLGHKTRSFGKLLAYVQRGAETDGAGGTFSRNLICDAADVEAVRQAFEENARHLTARRGGNWCYHEIIALPKAVKEKTRAEGEAVLFELASRYVAARAPQHLVWGRVHWDAEHPHLHLVVSANALRSPRRTRLTRARFTKLVEELEAFKCERWPQELPEKLWQHRQRYNKQRRRHAEDHLTRRTGQASKRDTLAKTLTALFARARWPEALSADLTEAGLTLYRRGRAWGVIETATGKRHRLRTLGVLDAFRAMEARMQVLETRLDHLTETRQAMHQGRDRGAQRGRERVREPVTPSHP